MNDDLADISLVLISLGSNLGDRRRNIDTGLQAISELDCDMDRRSSLYETAPWGVEDQPSFINAACGIYTKISPQKLLEQLQEIENQHQRERYQKWGPRTLDIDIVSYGDLNIDTTSLKLPHPHFYERVFVLEPLAEIYPEHLINEIKIADHLQRLTNDMNN